MTLQEITSKIKTIKKGVMVKVHYITVKGDYTKETQSTIRFVKYANIKGVQAKNQGNANESHIVENMLIYNQNTKQYYLQMATINTNYKAKVKYYYQGQEIDKATYDKANPSKSNTQPLVVFRKNIKDIISLG